MSNYSEFPAKATFFGVVIVLLVIVCACSCSVVDPGHRGVKVTMGNVNPESVGSGVTGRLPIFTSVHEINVQQQTVTGDAPCFSKNTQQVKVTFTIMFRVPEENVVKLFRDYKGDPYQTLVEPRTQEALKQVVAKHDAEELIQQREVVRVAALERLKSMVGDLITIVDLNITNIDLSDQLEHAIEAKMVKQQESLAMQFETDKANKQAEITKVKANAEAEALKITAAALASSPSIIQLEVLKKWDGKSPSTLVINGGSAGGAQVVFPIGGDLPVTKPAP